MKEVIAINKDLINAGRMWVRTAGEDGQVERGCLSEGRWPLNQFVALLQSVAPLFLGGKTTLVSMEGEYRFSWIDH